MSKITIEIPLKEATKNEYFYGSNNDKFEPVHEEVIYFDLEKGYETKVMVLKRKEDSRFFRFKYSVSPHVDLDSGGLCNDDPLIGEEVFPKQKIITIYE